MINKFHQWCIALGLWGLTAYFVPEKAFAIIGIILWLLLCFILTYWFAVWFEEKYGE